MQHLYKIMAKNTKCDTVTSDFASDTIKCKICQKLVHIIYLVSLNMLTSSLHIYLFILYVLNTCYLCSIYTKLWPRIQNVTLLQVILRQIQSNAKFVRNWCIHVFKLIYLLILCLMLHIAGILIIAKMHLLSCTLMMIKLFL